MTGGTVADLCVYPVKSARGCRRDKVVVGPRGLHQDRDWMLVDERGRFLSQRTLARMARLTATEDPDGLTLAFADERTHVQTPTGGAWTDVEIWGDAVRARQAAASANEALSRWLERPVRLVWMPPEVLRPVDPDYAGHPDVPVSFADGYPILVASASSLADLNSRLPTSIPMERFRPNIVIADWPAYAEDAVRRIRIGAVELSLVKPCTRCNIPMLDHLTGEPSTDPTAVLRQYRFDRALRGVTFGVNALVVSGAGHKLRLGDSVAVLA